MGYIYVCKRYHKQMENVGLLAMLTGEHCALWAEDDELVIAWGEGRTS